MIDLLIEIPEDQTTPYGALENSYWNQPREVCVVDEINPINDAMDAEVICDRSTKNEEWVNTVAMLHGFKVEKTEEKGTFGTYRKFIVKKEILR